MKKIAFTLFAMVLFLHSFVLKAQQQESYTFCTGSSYAYLFDTSATTSSGYYARWAVSQTAYSAHFLNDTIYQSTGSGSGGGSWGSVKKWACTSPTAATNVWTYTITGGHHDICPLPNGNVLIIVHDSKTSTQVSAVGGTYSGTVQSEKIQEIHQTGATTGVVVWEWKLWDHLCQSTNSSITSTYVSSVSANPQLMNVNYNMSSDWVHMNGIDYNPVLDQIIVSSHMLNEVWIIDHSTTTAQAATHSGGNAGRGGDFLYRWGNPAAYGCASGGNGITLNTIHDARWVSANNSKYPNYISMYHNNGGGTVQAVLALPPHNGYNYTYTAGSVIPPTSCTKPTIQSITGVPDQGSVFVEDNGNILVTKPNTAFYECSGLGTTYQSLSVATNQADRLKKCEVYGPFATASSNVTTSVCANSSFTLNATGSSPLQTSPTFTYSWSSSPAGFTSTSQNPTVTPTAAGNYTYTVTVTTAGCTKTASVNVTVDACSGITENSATEKPHITPNPSTGIITIDDNFVANNQFDIFVTNSIGKTIIKSTNQKEVNLSDYNDGIYFVTIRTSNNDVYTEKIILIK